MDQRFYKIIVASLLLVIIYKAEAQTSFADSLEKKFAANAVSVSSGIDHLKFFNPHQTFTLTSNSQAPPTLTLIRGDYYTRNFGFFCRKELQFEKTTGIPFKFRLGSMEFANKLEGKK